MVAAVAVEDVERLDRVEVVLLRIGREDLRHAGVESASENRREARLLEPLAIGPLPRVLEMRLFRRLVVRRVEIGGPSREAGVHDREILVGKRDVHHEVGFVVPHEGRQARHVHRVDLRRRDARRRAAAFTGGLHVLAPLLRPRRDQQIREHVRIPAHLGGRDGRDAARADQEDFRHGFLFPFLVFVSGCQRQQAFAEELAGKGRGPAARVQRGGELNEVERHHVEASEHVHQHAAQRLEREAARLRRARAGKLRRVEHVEVDRQVDGRLRRQDNGRQGFRGEPLRPNTPRPLERELLLRAGPDTELEDAPVTQQVMAPPHHAGVGKRVAEVVRAQVGMGVEVKDVEIRMARTGRAHRAERDEVFAAEEDGDLPRSENPRRFGFDHLERGIRRAERQLQVARVVDGAIPQVPVEIGRIGLDAERLVANRRRAEARPRTVGGGRIEGRAEKDGPCRVKATVASDEVHLQPLLQAFAALCPSSSRT